MKKFYFLEKKIAQVWAVTLRWWKLSSRSARYICRSTQRRLPKIKEWIEYKRTNQINDTSAINFNITAQSSAFVNLKSSVLKVKLRLTDGNGTPLNKKAIVGLMNPPLHSIFKWTWPFSRLPYLTRVTTTFTRLISIPSLKPLRLIKREYLPVNYFTKITA